MAHIVFAWELGGSYGHITRMHLTAELLIAANHRVSFIVPNPAILEKFGATPVTENAGVYSAPKARKKVKKTSRSPDNFSEILLSLHYYDPKLLEVVIKDWRCLLEKLNPDLICFDSAPTAILAARTLQAKTVNIGQYYFIPPDHYPMPSFTRNKKISNKTLKKSDDFLLQNIQKAINDTSEPSIYRYLKTDLTILATIPEVDFYASYRCASTRYHGSLISRAFGDKPIRWDTKSQRKKIFGYLKTSYRCLKEFLKVLSEQEHIEAKIYISGASQAVLDHYLENVSPSSCIELSAEPYILDASLADVDLIVCHSGGSIMHAVFYGKPLLTIPLQREQMMRAQCCIDAGIAVGLNPEEADSIKIKGAICQSLYEQSLRNKAIELKNKYLLNHVEEAQRLVVSELESLVDT